MKRKKIKDIFVESFYELAKSKSVDKITVKEIATYCGYSSATFYRHFQDKYDLITWGYAQEVEEIMSQIGKKYSWKDTLKEGAEYFEKKKAYLTNLFLHTHGQDCFLYSMIEINYQALKKHIQKSKGLGEEIPLELQTYIRTYCFSTVLLTYEWSLERVVMSAEKLSQIYRDILPSVLEPYLIER